jgi:hypothetical protein
MKRTIISVRRQAQAGVKPDIGGQQQHKADHQRAAHSDQGDHELGQRAEHHERDEHRQHGPEAERQLPRHGHGADEAAAQDVVEQVGVQHHAGGACAFTARVNGGKVVAQAGGDGADQDIFVFEEANGKVVRQRIGQRNDGKTDFGVHQIESAVGPMREVLGRGHAGHGQGQVGQCAFLQVSTTRKTVAFEGDVDVRHALGCILQHGLRFVDGHGRQATAARLLDRQIAGVAAHLGGQGRVVGAGVGEEDVKTNGFGLVARVGQFLQQVGVDRALEGPAAQLLQAGVVDADDDNIVGGQRGPPTVKLVINDVPRRFAPAHQGKKAEGAERQKGHHQPFEVKAPLVPGVVLLAEGGPDLCQFRQR